MRTLTPSCRTGFTRADLLALVGCVALLATLLATCGATSRTRSEAAVCQSNLRRLAQAMNLYATGNRGYVAHSSWGADLTGPDNWAYATRNNGRLPGLPVAPSSAAGRSDESAQVVAQRKFLHIGQLWPLVRDDRAFRCPSDGITTPQRRSWYLSRAQKVTSYCMNGAAIGFGQLPGSQTYPLTSFLGDAVAFWEPDERQPFFFNDAANQPSDGPSLRHSKGSHVGRFDGGVEFWSNRQFRKEVGHLDEQGEPSPLPNRVWCNPGRPNGGF